MEKVFISFDKEPGYAMKESLRSLRTNIQFCGDDVRTIMFTSCVPDEGKSTVVLDLARSISESGKNVLLIDTDMRKSVLLRRLHAKGENNKEIYGLSHFLSGQKTIEEVFYSTNVPGLFLVFAGPSVPNPTEILEKNYLKELLDLGETATVRLSSWSRPESAAVWSSRAKSSWRHPESGSSVRSSTRSR